SSSLAEVGTGPNEHVESLHGNHTADPEKLTTGHRDPQASPRFFSIAREEYLLVNSLLPNMDFSFVSPQVNNLPFEIAAYGHNRIRLAKHLLDLFPSAMVVGQQEDIGAADNYNRRHADDFSQTHGNLAIRMRP